jgi:N6-L-threonylcarbamoyladenine synthase
MAREPQEPGHPIRILGIETSCDETAAAVVENGARVLSSVVASQMATHGKYGGVVPELASREHLRAIVPIVRQAVEDAGIAYSDLDAIAVTQGPGLVGALLVGLTYAKSLALALGKPLVAVNHLEGHIHAVILEERLNGRPDPEFPALALVVSGGHTLLAVAERAAGKSVPSVLSVDSALAVPSVGSVPSEFSEDSLLFSYRIIGRTRDDAAGEAYDKVAKLLGYGYPGGPVLDRLARHGNPDAVSFTKPKMKTTSGSALDFSFSGIKTAVLRYVESHGMAAEIAERNAFRKQNPKAGLDELLSHSSRRTLDLVASFQRAVVDSLVEHTLAAAERESVNSIFITGGVAANSLLRERLTQLRSGSIRAVPPCGISERTLRTAEQSLRATGRATERGRVGYPPVYFPRLSLSTDNAAMIAAAAFPKFQARQFAGWDTPPDASLALGQ